MNKNSTRKITQAELIGTELGMHINRVNAEFKQYQNWLSITQNIMIALARACKISPKALAEMMASERGNSKFEADVMVEYDKLVHKHSRMHYEMADMKKGMDKGADGAMEIKV